MQEGGAGEELEGLPAGNRKSLKGKGGCFVWMGEGAGK